MSATQEQKYKVGERSIEDIIASLSRQLPDELLKTKTLKGNAITYIEWHTAVRILDKHAPGWNYEVRSVSGIGDNLVVIARISIPCAEGIVYREATGIEDDDSSGYGDSASNAEAMALKRCAAKFGLGLYLYRKDKKVPQQGVASRSAPQPQAPQQMPSDPVARTMAALVTPKQMAALRAIANDRGVTLEPYCIERLKCRPEELSKRAASVLIDELKAKGAAA